MSDEAAPERDNVIPMDLYESMSPRERAAYNEALGKLPPHIIEQREASKRRHPVNGMPPPGFSVVEPEETAAQIERYRQQDQTKEE